MLSGITSSCCMGCFCLEEQSSPYWSPDHDFWGSEEPPARSSAFCVYSSLYSRFPSVGARAAGTTVSAALPPSLEEPSYQRQGTSVQTLGFNVKGNGFGCALRSFSPSTLHLLRFHAKGFYELQSAPEGR